LWVRELPGFDVSWTSLFAKIESSEIYKILWFAIILKVTQGQKY